MKNVRSQNEASELIEGPIDSKIFLRLSGVGQESGEDVTAQFITHFLTNTPHWLKELETALGSNDRQSRIELAQRLKHECETLGAVRMASIVKEFEHNGGAETELLTRLGVLRQEFDRATEWLAGRMGPLAAGWMPFY